jgi:LCCL domain
MVGAEEINYQSLVVGGPTEELDPLSTKYRGDSFVCGAAIHAGIFKDWRGGCGVLSRLGEGRNFPSVARNGIRSVGFIPSY